MVVLADPLQHLAHSGQLRRTEDTITIDRLHEIIGEGSLFESPGGLAVMRSSG